MVQYSKRKKNLITLLFNTLTYFIRTVQNEKQKNILSMQFYVYSDLFSARNQLIIKIILFKNFCLFKRIS